jgi:hypothetical protein
MQKSFSGNGHSVNGHADQASRDGTTTQPTNRTNWRDILPIHPAADLFPLMSEAELRELADDIKKNGLKDQLTLYKDQNLGLCLLDGRNRLDAMALSGRNDIDERFKRGHIPASCRVIEKCDPVAYVISKNIHRRHLTAEQKRDLIAKLLKAKPEMSDRQIAAQAKTYGKAVTKVRRELESTATISQLKKTIGKDGKERPTRKAVVTFGSPCTKRVRVVEAEANRKAEQKAFQSPEEEEHAFEALSRSWFEVERQIEADNLTRLRGALEIHREKIDHVLKGLSP